MRIRLLTLSLLLGASGCGSHEMAHDPNAAAAPESTPIAPITGDAVFVVNGGDSTIVVLDPATAAIKGTIALKNVTFPHHLYMSPDAKKLALAVPGHDLSMGHSAAAQAGSMGGEHGGGQHGSSSTTSSMTGAVLVLDATTGAMLKSRVLDAPNHNATFSPDGREIWTALLMDEGAVLVLDAETLETKQTVAVGKVPAEVTFSPDGRYAFVANGTSDTVSIIDPATKTVVKTIPVDREPVGAWPGADGLMYVDCEVAKTVKAIDPKTLEIVRSYDLKFTPGIATVPPGRTDELWLTDADAGKVVLNRTAADQRVADVSTGAGAHAIGFTPDGKTAFVTNQLAESVTLIDTTSRAPKTSVRVGNKPNAVLFRRAR